MDVPAAQHALVLEAEPYERRDRPLVLGARQRGGAQEAERAKGERQDHRLRLGVRAAAPVRAAEPGADDRAAVAARELAQPGDPDRPVARVHDRELESLARLALALERVHVVERLGDILVGAPGEEAGHLRVPPELEQRGRVRLGRVAQGEARAADDHRGLV